MITTTTTHTKPNSTASVTRCNLVLVPLASLALALGALACGGKSTQKTAKNDFADMTWKEKDVASDKADVSKMSKLATGESMVWRFSLFGIELGRLALAVGEPGAMDGKQVAIIRGKVETTKMAAVFAPVQQELTTFVDTATLQPVYHRREVDKGTQYKWVETKLSNKSFAVDYRERDKDSDTHGEQKFVKELPIFDINAFLLAARAWNVEPGERIEVNVFREVFVWNLQIERTKEETIKTAMGEFPAIRFDCIGRRINRDGTFDTTIDPREYSFWLSDDHKRLPLMMLARTDYGDARIELIEHGKVAGK